jgi:hypothetical protein
MYCAAVGWNVLCITVSYIWSIVFVRSAVSLLSLCVDNLAICESGVWKSPTTIVLCLFFSSYLLVWFVYLCTFDVYIYYIGTYMFITVIYSCWIEYLMIFFVVTGFLHFLTYFDRHLGCFKCFAIEQAMCLSWWLVQIYLKDRIPEV